MLTSLVAIRAKNNYSLVFTLSLPLQPVPREADLREELYWCFVGNCDCHFESGRAVQGYRTFSGDIVRKKVIVLGTNVRNQALDILKPIWMGGTLEEKVTLMLETTVDYWTCIDLAQALEQTMRNDLWSTAERIAETASRISNKPDELVVALKKFSVYQAANNAATEIAVLKASTDTTHLSKAG